MKNNNSANENLTYEAFAAWHVEASARLQAGESLATPSQKFYEHWRNRRVEEARLRLAHEVQA